MQVQVSDTTMLIKVLSAIYKKTVLIKTVLLLLVELFFVPGIIATIGHRCVALLYAWAFFGNVAN